MSSRHESKDDFISSFRVAKRFSQCTKPILSMHINEEGSTLAASSLDECIYFYDLIKGEFLSKSSFKKYGAELVKFVPGHSDQLVVTSRNGWDETIRLVSMTDSNPLRVYRGHRSLVTSLAFNATQSELFVSSSRDNTIKLWDNRTTTCQGSIEEDDCRVAMDPLGVVLVSATSNGRINLYDLRSFDGGPFRSWQLDGLSYISYWSSIEFSPSGKEILVSTASNGIFVLDSFFGDRIFDLTSRSNKNNHNLPSCYGKSGEYILSGSDNGNLHIWKASNGNEASVLASNETSPLTNVIYHQSLDLIATGSNYVQLWLPKSETASDNNTADEWKMEIDFKQNGFF